MIVEHELDFYEMYKKEGKCYLFNELLFINEGNEYSTWRNNMPRKHRVVASVCPANKKVDGSYWGPKAKCDDHWARENIPASSSAMGVGVRGRQAEEDDGI